MSYHHVYFREFGKWERYTTGFGSRILAKVSVLATVVHCAYGNEKLHKLLNYLLAMLQKG